MPGNSSLPCGMMKPGFLFYIPPVFIYPFENQFPQKGV